MKNAKIRLTRNELKHIIKESIVRLMNEGPETMGKHRRLINQLNKEYSDGKAPTRIYNKGKAEYYNSKNYKTVDNGERTKNSLKLHHEILGMDVINTIGRDCYLTFDLYMDDKLYAKFDYTITDIKDINEKRIYLRGTTDTPLFKRELYLTYNIANGSFKRPNASGVYKFVLNTNTASPQGSHNASVMQRLLQYKDIYLKEVVDNEEDNKSL
ncbi:MAG: hypothetical protein IKX60_06355 [Bacteroidales bacterium]|nr:hypothetical protein [Bacteroidales bacterium]